MSVDRFEYERGLVGKGAKRIAGVDEVGRGPLAGPVVAAAVVLPIDWIRNGLWKSLAGLNDSKQLSARRREQFHALLISNPSVQYGIALVEAVVIDRINILRATCQAMNQAVAQLRPSPDHVLVDGRRNEGLDFRQTAVVGGDALSYSIAAASVLAKVVRDKLMSDYATEFPGYGFASHKGYGTREHLSALSRLGPCRIHRRSFAPLKEPEPELFEM